MKQLSVVLMTLFTAAVLLGSCSDNRNSAPSSAGPVMMAIEVNGEQVQHNEALITLLAGAAGHSESAVEDVGCVNADFWLSDRSLAPVAVLSTNRQLGRAASLVKSGRFDYEVMRAVEQYYWEGGDLSDLPPSLEVDLSQAADYVMERADSVEAIPEEVVAVFASAIGTNRQVIYYVDRSKIVRNHLNTRAGVTSTVFVPVASGRLLSAAEVTSTDCMPE